MFWLYNIFLCFDTTGEADLLIAVAECEGYQEKITTCLNIFAKPVTLAPHAPELPKSFLKSPQAPLPSFSSEAGENFELFLQKV